MGVGEEAPNREKPSVYAYGLVVVGENSVIPPDVCIGKNTAITGFTVPEDYPGGYLAAGETLERPLAEGIFADKGSADDMESGFTDNAKSGSAESTDSGSMDNVTSGSTDSADGNPADYAGGREDVTLSSNNWKEAYGSDLGKAGDAR